jgi:hypothetical protein
MSLDDAPSAPGAPSGQSGTGVCMSARENMSDENKIAEVKMVFMAA